MKRIKKKKKNSLKDISTAQILKNQCLVDIGNVEDMSSKIEIAIIAQDIYQQFGPLPYRYHKLT